MSGLTDFEDFIARVDSLAKLNEQVAKAALDPVTSAARETAAAGTTPTDKAWAPKRSGGQALTSAANEIESSASGAKIELKIDAPLVFHQHGAGGTSTTKEAVRARKRAEATRAKGGTSSKFHAPRRQIIPAPGDAIPPKMADAIKKAAETVFKKAIG